MPHKSGRRRGSRATGNERRPRRPKGAVVGAQVYVWCVHTHNCGAWSASPEKTTNCGAKPAGQVGALPLLSTLGRRDCCRVPEPATAQLRSPGVPVSRSPGVPDSRSPGAAGSESSGTPESRTSGRWRRVRKGGHVRPGAGAPRPLNPPISPHAVGPAAAHCCRPPGAGAARCAKRCRDLTEPDAWRLAARRRRLRRLRPLRGRTAGAASSVSSVCNALIRTD